VGEGRVKKYPAILKLKPGPFRSLEVMRDPNASDLDVVIRAMDGNVSEEPGLFVLDREQVELLHAALGVMLRQTQKSEGSP
jgi:hypothetical protein